MSTPQNSHYLSASWEAKGRDVWKCMRDMRDKGEKRCVSNIVQYMQGNIYIINRACNICEDGAFDIH